MASDEVVAILHTSRLARWERRIEAALLRALDGAEALTIDSLSLVAAASGLPSSPLEGPEWEQLVLSEVQPAAEAVAFEVSALMVDALAAELPAFPLPDLSAQVARLVAKARGIGPHFAEAIGRNLAQGISEGEGIPDLSKRVQEAFDTNAYRATTIARTETLSTVNGAQHETAGVLATAAGDGLHKTWIATEDARTRPTHALADRQTVPYDTPFAVGATVLDYPGDPLGTAEEVINCRCAVAYRHPDDAPLRPPSPVPA